MCRAILNRLRGLVNKTLKMSFFLSSIFFNFYNFSWVLDQWRPKNGPHWRKTAIDLISWNLVLPILQKFLPFVMSGCSTFLYSLARCSLQTTNKTHFSYFFLPDVVQTYGFSPFWWWCLFQQQQKWQKKKMVLMQVIVVGKVVISCSRLNQLTCLLVLTIYIWSKAVWIQRNTHIGVHTGPKAISIYLNWISTFFTLGFW